MPSSNCLVLVPATAASVVLAFGFARASGFIEVGALLSAAAVLLAAHVALRARAGRRIAEEEALAAKAQLELQARVGECERRRQSLAAFSQLAGHVAHEVRNPLASIGLNLELLEEEVGRSGAGGGAVEELLKAIRGEAARLQRLTDEYLGFSRPRPSDQKPDDLRAIARELAQFVAQEAARTGIDLRLDTQAEPVPASIDRHHLTQAALNLVRNAMQATKPGRGGLTISARTIEGRAVLAVEDAGPGVAPEERARIFEPFYSTKAGGTGLGLPLALQIAREHRGEIVVEAGEKGGARFSIVLPLLAEAEAGSSRLLRPGAATGAAA